jgi:membrane-associated phospholipid phosphatase
MASKLSDEQGQKVLRKTKEKVQLGSSFVRSPRYGSLSRGQFLLLPSILQLALFASLAWWAHKHPVDARDVRITRALQKKRSSFLRNGVITITYISGSPAILRILTFPIAFVLWKLRLRLEAVMTVSIGMTSELLKSAVQVIVGRPRPSPLLVHVYTKSHGKSFPSGHVVSSISFWGWLMALGAILWPRKRGWQKALLGVPALFLGLIGPSRIYLGEHWASDVIGGYLFGGAWLGLSVQLYLKLRGQGVLAEEKGKN